MERRINITLPEQTHKMLRMYCVQNDMTMAQAVIEALQGLLSDEQRGASKVKPPV